MDRNKHQFLLESRTEVARLVKQRNADMRAFEAILALLNDQRNGHRNAIRAIIHKALGASA